MSKSKSRKGPAQRKSKAYRPRILVLEALTGSSRCVRVAGGLPVTANPRRLESCLEKLQGEWDALLLTGGGDVDPRRYGEKPHKQVYGVNETRDRVEFAAIKLARKRGVPVLGICRGAQIMCIEAGGDLHQHIGRGHYGKHVVSAPKPSVLRKAAGPTMNVVSYHHQAIRALPKNWRVSAQADDGTIEAIETLSGRCLGVQFHPEQDAWEEYAQRIFRWLVVSAAEKAGHTLPRFRPAARPPAPAEQLTLPLPQGKHREAGTRPYVSAYAPSVWVCHHCGIRFTNLKDREDHIAVLHGGDRLVKATVNGRQVVGRESELRRESVLKALKVRVDGAPPSR